MNDSLNCAGCLHPIRESTFTWSGNGAYHNHCYPRTVMPSTPVLTAEAVRQIVCEEIAKARRDWLRAAGVVVKEEGEDV